MKRSKDNMGSKCLIVIIVAALLLNHTSEILGNIVSLGNMGSSRSISSFSTTNIVNESDVANWAYVNNLPKLSEESARQFLAFVYCNHDYASVDLSQDDVYNLLIGNYSVFNSVSEMKFTIWSFSLFVRTSMNYQVAESNYVVDFLIDDLAEFWYEEYLHHL